MKLKEIMVLVLVFMLAGTFLLITPVQAEEEYDLRLKLKQGRKYKLESTTTQSLTQRVQAKKMSMKQTFVMDYEIRVKKITPENNYVLAVEYTNFAMKVLDIKSDFGKEGQKELAQQLNEELKQSLDYILNKEFVIKLTPAGQIIDIEGYRQLMSNLLANEESKQVKKNLKQMLNKDAMKKSWSQSFSYLPQESVSVGDSWKKSFKLTKPVPMEIVTRYTLEDINQTQVVINSNAEIKMGSLNLPKQNNLEINTDFSGSQSGQIILNRKNNWVQQMNLKQELTGLIAINNPRRDKSLEIPMEMIIEIEMTGGSTLIPLEIAGNKGIKVVGPERISFKQWVTDRFNYGVGLMANADGVAVPLSGGYVVKEMYSGRLRFAATGGYSLTVGQEENNDDYMPPEFWAGLELEYSFTPQWSIAGFYGLLGDDLGPQAGVTYYW